MSWRDLAVQDIKRAEDCRLVAYQDEGGVWTIGWGHTYRVYRGQVCTQAQADAWFEQDFGVAEQDLDKHALWWQSAPDPIRRGLVNMCFNLGWPRLSGFIEMLDAGACGDWSDMADEAEDSKWDHQVGERAEFVVGLFRGANQMELEV